MRARIHWVVLLLLLCTASVPAAAGPMPVDLDEIPVFPGAVRDPVLEDSYSIDLYFNPISWDKRAYTVPAIIDDAARFYLDYTQGTRGFPAFNPSDFEPGDTLGPWYVPEFYGSYIFEHVVYQGQIIRDGNWVRQVFAQRPQWEPGLWLRKMSFGWTVIGEQREEYRVSIQLEDQGYSEETHTDYKSTNIFFVLEVFEPEKEPYGTHGPGDDEEFAEWMDKFELYVDWARESGKLPEDWDDDWFME